MFEIDSTRLTFWIDRTNEIPEWTIDELKGNEKHVKNELKLLFSNAIEVEYKGNRTIVKLIDSHGDIVREFRYCQGIHFNFLFKSKSKKYKPYFESVLPF